MAYRCKLGDRKQWHGATLGLPDCVRDGVIRVRRNLGKFHRGRTCFSDAGPFVIPIALDTTYFSAHRFAQRLSVVFSTSYGVPDCGAVKDSYAYAYRASDRDARRCAFIQAVSSAVAGPYEASANGVAHSRALSLPLL
jgi:hypothetical protein